MNQMKPPLLHDQPFASADEVLSTDTITFDVSMLVTVPETGKKAGKLHYP